MRRFILIMSIIGLAATLDAAAQRGLPAGYGEYDVADAATGKNVRVYYYKPSDYTPDSPILFALHGDDRTAYSYRLEWKAHAEKLGFMLLAPHFSADEFPGSNGFQLGNVVSGAGGVAGEEPRANPEETWVFSIIERLFDDFGRREDTRRQRYAIYGHSAGAQFVHRMMLFKKDTRVEFAVAANAGWYLQLDPAADWPFGLKGVESAVADVDIDRYLSFPLVIALGDADVNDDHKLNTTEMAMRQGANRFERGNAYFERCRELARKRGAAFGWTKIVVPNVGHSNAGMAAGLAEYLGTAWWPRGK